MARFDANTLDSEFDGAAVLAAVLYPTPAAKADARERGRQRLENARSLAEAFAVAPAADRTAPRGVEVI